MVGARIEKDLQGALKDLKSMTQLKNSFVFGNVWTPWDTGNDRSCVQEQTQQISYDIYEQSKIPYDLLDILTEIVSAKDVEQYATLLSYYDSFSVSI